MSETWIPVRIQNTIYATNPKTGSRRELRMSDGWTIAHVSGMNESITVTYTNGRVRVWNPETDSVTTVN